MQLPGQFGDRGVDQRRAAPFVEFGGDDAAGGRNRDIDRDRADFGNRPRLLLRDPLFGKVLAPL